MILAAPRLTSLRHLASAAALGLTLMSGTALAETVAAAPGMAATSSAILNAQAKVNNVRATPATKSVRVRQPARVAAQTEPCSWFSCGRRQVSWLVLGVGF